jgi:allophanate hydrolase
LSLVVETPGLCTLVEAAPRRGLRHLGVPAAGAADPLSLALANRLVGNALAAAALEVTLSGMSLVSSAPCRIAVTGATCAVSVNGRTCAMHTRIDVPADARIEIGAAERGARSYLAIEGAFAAREVLGSVSTYLPARLGGQDGRALEVGDVLEIAGDASGEGASETRPEFRWVPPVTWTLRAMPGAEFDLLDAAGQAALFAERFQVGGRNDRMGVALDGIHLHSTSTGDLDSRPVFPGTVQCPESGQLFVMGVDAQTTGGYARVAEVIRADRSRIGQLRTGAAFHFLRRDVDTAARELKSLHAFWSDWLPGIEAFL